jgi:vacuolar-type H+-ATPase subunit I/STV1
MSRAVPPRSLRPSDPISRPTTSTRTKRAAPPQPEIKPSQIHDLKLLTQQYQQQTKLLRTQLKRTQIQINAKTLTINKTFEQSGNSPTTSKTIHEHTIENLARNIEGAKNTLDKLREEIDLAERDDRTSTVEELEEDLKMTFCEYQRLVQLHQQKTIEAQYFKKELADCEYRVSNEHVGELRAVIRTTRAENASLRDKSNAYQVKLEKIRIEAEIFDNHDRNIASQDVLDQVELNRAENNRRLNELCSELNEDAEKHDQNVSELMSIVEEMKQKIADRLDAANGPLEDPDEVV